MRHRRGCAGVWVGWVGWGGGGHRYTGCRTRWAFHALLRATDERRAATTLQSLARRVLASKEAAARRLVARRLAAARLIQRTFRGWCGRGVAVARRTERFVGNRLIRWEGKASTTSAVYTKYQGVFLPSCPLVGGLWSVVPVFVWVVVRCRWIKYMHSLSGFSCYGVLIA
jgi:hypothetical protein